MPARIMCRQTSSTHTIDFDGSPAATVIKTGSKPDRRSEVSTRSPYNGPTVESVTTAHTRASGNTRRTCSPTRSIRSEPTSTA